MSIAKYFGILLPAIFFPLFAGAQKCESETITQDISIADMDKDGKTDTLLCNYDTGAITFQLSSRGFEAYQISFPAITLPANFGGFSSVLAREGKVDIRLHFMRASNSYQYVYEAKSERFRLARYYREDFGNAANDGSGTMEHDFLAQEFTGCWNYYDIKADSLRELPAAVVQHIYNRPIYIDDGDVEFVSPGYDFFDKYKQIYEPPFNDTLRFVMFDTESGDYKTLHGITPEGIWIGNSIFGFGRELLYKDDLIETTTSISFYQEPGDGSFHAAMMITDINLIEAGKLRLFLENNHKEINYHKNNIFEANICEQSRQAMDYFLAVTNSKKIRKYLKKQGNLEIYFRECITEESSIEQTTCVFAEIFNIYHGKREIVGKILLDLSNVFMPVYYLHDNKTGKLMVLEVD